MGCIIDSCEYNNNLFLETSICYSALVIFIINLALIIKVIHQIFLYYKKKGQIFTRKLIIFYLLLIQIIANTLYSGIRSWDQLYLIDIVQRHFVFIYLIYYFGRKLKNIIESANFYQRNSHIILTICSSLYFSGLLLYGLAESTKEDAIPTCKQNYWVYMRIGGLFIIFFFIIVGSILVKRHTKVYESNADFTMLIKYSVARNSVVYNETEKSLIEKNIENILVKDERNYNLWLIMAINFFSGVLSLTTAIYYAIMVESTSTACGFYPFDKEITDSFTGLLIVGWCFYLINYFIPIIIILKVFLFKEVYFPVYQASISEEEAYPYQGNLKVKGPDEKNIRNEKSLSPKSSYSSMNNKHEGSFIFSEVFVKKEGNESKEEEEEKKGDVKSSGFL